MMRIAKNLLSIRENGRLEEKKGGNSLFFGFLIENNIDPTMEEKK